MSRINKEWSFILILGAFVLALGIYAKSMNQESFRDVAKIIYAVAPEVGNLREGPTTNSEIIKKMKQGDIFRILKSKGNWFFGKSSLYEGWAHRSILKKYLYLGYYDEYILNKSTFELEWN